MSGTVDIVDRLWDFELREIQRDDATTPLSEVLADAAQEIRKLRRQLRVIR